MSGLPSVPIDLEALGTTRGRLERALELVDTIIAAGAELAELAGVDVADQATARAIEATLPPPVRDDGEDDVPAPTPSPPGPDSAADAPPAPAAEPPASAPAWEAFPDDDPTPAAPDGNARRATARASTTRATVRAAWEALDGWHGLTELRRLTGFSQGPCVRMTRELAEEGFLEHNGKGGRWSLYRRVVDEDQGEPAGEPQEAVNGSHTPSETGAEPAAIQPSGPAPEPSMPEPASSPAMSPRVRRELAREEADRQRAATAGARILEGRITQALQVGACGIRGIAKRLGYATPNEELVTTLAVMVRHGDVRRFDNPRRSQVGQENPLFEVLGC